MERICGNCRLCNLKSISVRDALNYAQNAVGIFGEEKAEEVLKYIQSIRNAGGGKRQCSAPRPFAYPNDPCDSSQEFEVKS